MGRACALGVFETMASTLPKNEDSIPARVQVSEVICRRCAVSRTLPLLAFPTLFLRNTKSVQLLDHFYGNRSVQISLEYFF